MTVVPGEGANDDREEVQHDRDDDPLPAHLTERAPDRGEAAAPPPEQARERREDDEPQEHPHDTARRQAHELAQVGHRVGLRHRPIIVGDPVRLRSTSRPRDRPPGAAGPRRARGRAAVRPRRHGDRRPSGRPADRRARPRRNGARRRLHDLQLPHLRDDGGRRARLGRGPARARPRGSRRRRSGLSLGIGVALLVVLRDRRRAASRAGSAAHGRSGDFALTYFRIAAFGLPAALVALAGQGYLRGVSNLRRPLEIVVVANVANLVLELLFVYVFHWGIAGSAAGTAIAQAGMGVAFVVELLRPHAPSRRPSLARDAADGARRAADLRAHGRALRVVPRRGVGARAHGRRADRRAPDRVRALHLPRARARRASRSRAR